MLQRWVGWRSTCVEERRRRIAAAGGGGSGDAGGRVGEGWRSVGRYRASRGAGQGGARACACSSAVDISVSIMTGVGACITIPKIYCFQRQNIQEIERKIITKT